MGITLVFSLYEDKFANVSSFKIKIQGNSLPSNISKESNFFGSRKFCRKNLVLKISHQLLLSYNNAINFTMILIILC